MATLITKNSSTASAVPAAGDLVKGELAVNVTDKKLYTKDNGGSVVKVVGGLGNQEANAVAITGGAINGTTIGATTASTGAFTTVSASSGFTGNLTGNVTGNVSGTAANVTGIVAPANGGTGLSALGTGVQTALGQNVTGSGSFVLSTSPSLTTPNLGTPSAAVLTNATGLPLTTGVTGTLGVANGGTGITAFGTGVATALGQNVTGSGGIVLAASPSLTTPNLGTPSAATLTNATGLPISTGVSGLGTGVATALAVNTGSAGAFVVNGGALGTPSSGTLTNATGLPLSTGVTGTLATTNGGTGLTSFTANGVVYASSSSALTTGSALTFSGGIFGVSDASSPRISVEGSSTASGYLIFKNTTSGLNRGYVGYEFANDAMPFAVAGAEQMRLTSTGLGIGTSSPSRALTIERSGAAFPSTANPSVRLNETSSGRFAVMELDSSQNLNVWNGDAGAGSIRFYRGGGSGTLSMSLDGSGNLGLGVTPSAWYPGVYTVLDVGAASSFGGYAAGASGDEVSFMATNTFFNSSNNPIYKASGLASNYRQFNGVHQWFTAPSGTAGDAISFGDPKMTLDASGNLGIGTSSPAYKLDVQGSATDFVAFSGLNTNNNAGLATSSAIKFGFTSTVGTHYATLKITEDAGNDNSGSLTISLPFGGVESTKLTLNSSGNLGLGVTPSASISGRAFEIGAAGHGLAYRGAADIGVTQNAYWTSGAWRYGGTTGVAVSVYQQVDGQHRWLNAPSGTAGNAISFTQAMTLDASGNLGIGTTSIGARLDVQGANVALASDGLARIGSDSSGADTGGQITFKNSNARRAAIAGRQEGGDALAGYLQFGTRGTSGDIVERARIDSSGNLLVGTTSTNETSGTGGRFGADGYVRSTRAGSTSAASTLDVYSTGASAFRFYVDMAGTVFATNTTISAISDQRLKENIQDIDAGLNAVMALKPRKFDWKSGKGKDIKGDRGFIAQEFEQVFPDLIDEWKDPAPEGEEAYKSVRQDLIPVLVKAIQEQQAIITDLRARVAQLEAK